MIDYENITKKDLKAEIIKWKRYIDEEDALMRGCPFTRRILLSIKKNGGDVIGRNSIESWQEKSEETKAEYKRVIEYLFKF